jgi:protein SCO1/2
MRRLAPHALAIGLLALACGSPGGTPERQFAFRGQVLAVDAARNEITIKHEAIPGFMDAMTMPFSVRDRRLIDGRRRGDLVEGTLVVGDNDAWVSKLEKTGDAEVAPAPPHALERVELLRPGDTLPDATFTDQEGREVRLSSLRGSILVLTFIYTRCPLPTFCPAMDRRFNVIARRVNADPAWRDRVKLLSISFDPDFDRPEVLEKHARAVGADGVTWRFVTAPREAVEAFGSRLGLVVMREDQDPASITHNLRTAIVDARGRLVKLYSGSEWQPDEVLADLPRATT